MFRNSPKIHFLKQTPEKASKYVKRQALQNGYLGFSIFCVFDLKSFKNQFCWKNLYKPKSFSNFPQKTEYMLWRPVFAMSMPNFEAIRQFLVTKLPKKTRKLYTIQFLIATFCSSRPSTKIKIPLFNSPSETESDRHQFC